MRIIQLDKIFSILDQYDHAFFLGDYNFPDGKSEDEHISPKFSDVWKEVIKGIFACIQAVRRQQHSLSGVLVVLFTRTQIDIS